MILYYGEGYQWRLTEVPVGMQMAGRSTRWTWTERFVSPGAFVGVGQIGQGPAVQALLGELPGGFLPLNKFGSAAFISGPILL